MSALTLKILALVTMIIDHVGAVFFPQYVWLRYIGRLAMPIYAFLLVQGYFHTRSFARYAIRLAALAIVSEIPYDLLFHGTWLEFGNQNFVFTLLTALLVVKLLDLSAKKRNVFLFIAALALAVAPYFLHLDYGVYGVLAAVSFFLFRKYRGIDAAAFAGVTYLHCLQVNSSVQLYSIASCLPILLYNGKRGAHSLKYFFYIMYPAHLLLLYAIQYILLNNLLPFPR